ncbi:hypothetical protein H310_01836 [Aphanomyces invadans]|uniref:DUF1279 domain-containing protein n=1 Tax=Aphanomyces invadans TaxID=157072 RepID=A0A024UN47_9STRA|nr:hypothetical protein H310_01836 [Aphanomyces invadans]ETW07277.1 hypothetical protein H310_01836 [Aphanomyces invadans]|eukprot:XP_008863370.1 hypothetical protein H310_01836 [Aphanomyces invadans]
MYMLGCVGSIARRQMRQQSSFPTLHSTCSMSTGHTPPPVAPSSGPSDNNTVTPPDVPGNDSLAAKGKRFLKVYGMVGVVTHATLSVASYSILYMSISRGLDVGSFIGSWTTSVQAVALTNATSHGTSAAGVEAASTAVVAYAVYKLLAPIRWPLTFFVTPMVVRHWNRLRTPQKNSKSAA